MQMEAKKKAGVAILISDKVDLKKKSVIKKQRKALYNYKGINTGEYLTFVNIYAPDLEHLNI